MPDEWPRCLSAGVRRPGGGAASAGDLDFLLSRRSRKRIAVALIIGVEFVPSVKAW